MTSRVFVTAAAAGIVCVHASAAPPAAAPGPWSKVPALPTACYSSQDQWWEQNNAALHAVQLEHYRQNDINAAIQQTATDTFGADPMAVAARLQQQMMNDPQNAQKYLEQMMQQSQQAQAETPAQHEKEQQLDAESKMILKQYRAALAKAMGPSEARWTALKKKMGFSMEATAPWEWETSMPDWARAEWHAILRERDKAYGANCAQWWTAGGQMHGFMKRYKDFLVLERIPFEKKYGDESKLEHYRTLNVSTTGWRTTTDYEAAEDYMTMAASLFGQREERLSCPGGSC